MEQVAVRIGNSVGVVIPREIRQQVGIRPGTKLVVDTGPEEYTVRVRTKKKTSQTATKTVDSTITPEFLNWLESFNKRYAPALQELAKK